MPTAHSTAQHSHRTAVKQRFLWPLVLHRVHGCMAVLVTMIPAHQYPLVDVCHSQHTLHSLLCCHCHHHYHHPAPATGAVVKSV